ncbi:phosphohydrolase [Caulobacter sp. SLTY]|uniref:HD domain-containing protein n=1 Tax=Caulobacter sp. SLTY TaxID=2683262 RepID=UPI001411B945|nr:phosphohydrolase [Caulobacter sp. SLTY]NBB15841.1 phosphohydrolase [Caulobacter sp. SLTY]
MTPALEAAYAEPHRRYHGRAHIEACLRELAAVPDLSERDRRLLNWAIWWHDAVYDPRRADNEDVSAELARRDLAAMGADKADIDEVARLILLTKGHAVAQGDRLGALLVSIDLSILGADTTAYDAYVAGVRHEYGHVPEDAFRAGRARVMRHFLEAPVLYADPTFRDRLEVQARANIAREIAGLEA